MKYVYMNHRIKQKKPTGPVIVCQDDKLTVEANSFAIVVNDQIIGHVIFDPKGLDACESHEVKAWVEFNDKVKVIHVGKAVVKQLPSKPVASKKKPNVQVDLFG